MSDSFQEFDARLSRIVRRNTRLAYGYNSRVSRDGLIVFKPKRRRASLPLNKLMTLVIVFFGFKALVLAQVGIESYNQRLEALNEGTFVEQVGAWAMQADGVTVGLAKALWPLMH